MVCGSTSSKYSQHHESQTVRARELKFWENVHHVWSVTCHVSRVTCHVSHVTCHLSPVTCFFSFFFLTFYHYYFYIYIFFGFLVWIYMYGLGPNYWNFMVYLCTKIISQLKKSENCYFQKAFSFLWCPGLT